MQIDFFIKWEQMGIVWFDITHNVGLKTTPQIKVLKPKEVANIFHFMKNSFEIGDAREDGDTKQMVRMPAS